MLAGQALRVHPRACGGNDLVLFVSCVCEGPSPRLRGKPQSVHLHLRRHRSIPAPAGETHWVSLRCGLSRVHPRACGGNFKTLFLGENDEGPCGGNRGRWRRDSSRPGPSPRLRGKHDGGDMIIRYEGSIPAPAGETPAGGRRPGAYTVHPRACGGNGYRIVIGLCATGPSPRLRGKPRQTHYPSSAYRSIPAPAGGNI